MKALVLSGGKGTRIRPLANTTTKQLLPVANRPILFYIMDMVEEAGIVDVGLIVSAEWGNHVEQAVGDGSKWNTRVTYIQQPEPAGIAHAVKTARDFLKTSPFLMFLGDNVYKYDIKDSLAYFHKHSPAALLLLKEVDKPSNFGIAELDKDGKVMAVSEKPKEPRSNLALAGAYLFSPAVHQAIDNIKPSWRGELEITDALQELIDEGKDVHGSILDGWWLDTGDKDDLLKANRAVLDEYLKPDIQGRVEAGSQLMGKNEVGRGTVIKNSTVHGPSSIAENCLIRDSSVGPYACIGPDSIVERSSMENSIVLEGCRIQGIRHLKDSLLGKGAEVIRTTGKNGIIRLHVGDIAKVEIL